MFVGDKFVGDKLRLSLRRSITTEVFKVIIGLCPLLELYLWPKCIDLCLFLLTLLFDFIIIFMVGGHENPP